MKLTNRALKQINQQATRLKIALALSCSERWISKCIEVNKPNGPLTTAAALMVIKQETGLSDSEVLEAEAAKTAA